MIDPMEENRKRMAANAAGMLPGQSVPAAEKTANSATRGVPGVGRVEPIAPRENSQYGGTYVTPVEGGFQLEIPDELGRDFYVPLTGGTQAAQDVAALVQEYRGLADQGLSATEYQTLRDRAAAESAGAYQTAMRQTAQQQAAQNIRGGAAAGQQARLAQQYAMQEAQNAQELMIKDIEYKDKMRQDYGKQLAVQLGIAESDAAKLLGGQVAGLGAETAIYSSDQARDAFQAYIDSLDENESAEGGDTTLRDDLSDEDANFWASLFGWLDPTTWFG